MLNVVIHGAFFIKQSHNSSERHFISRDSFSSPRNVDDGNASKAAMISTGKLPPSRTVRQDNSRRPSLRTKNGKARSGASRTDRFRRTCLGSGMVAVIVRCEGRIVNRSSWMKGTHSNKRTNDSDRTAIQGKLRDRRAWNCVLRSTRSASI